MDHTIFLIVAVACLFLPLCLAFLQNRRERAGKIPPQQQEETLDIILHAAHDAWLKREKEYAEEPKMAPQTAYGLGYLDATIDSTRSIASQSFRLGPLLLLWKTRRS